MIFISLLTKYLMVYQMVLVRGTWYLVYQHVAVILLQ